MLKKCSIYGRVPGTTAELVDFTLLQSLYVLQEKRVDLTVNFLRVLLNFELSQVLVRTLLPQLLASLTVNQLHVSMEISVV
jgi:hypothetical protein